MKKLLLTAFIALTCMLSTTLKANAAVFNMCTATDTQDSSGTLYDSGGPNGEYQVDEDCTFLIHPGCADSIVLTFQSFHTETNYDSIYVYDGTSRSDPLLLIGNGDSLPPQVTCYSGYMLIVWHSDVSITDSGFACTWNSYIHFPPVPDAIFTSVDPTPPLGVPTQFLDQSTSIVKSWIWDFGDGDTSHSQNPYHSYATPGTYTVSLHVFTCSSSDSVTHTVTVQSAPEIDVHPTTGFTANAQCGDSISFPLDISNIAGGQLVYNTSGKLIGPIKVLAMTYGVDQFTEYLHTISAINQYFTNYDLTSTGTIDPGVLSGLLTGKNVLLICEQELGDPAVWTTLGPVIRQFLNNGGSVVFCGSYSSEADCMFNTGVFSGNFVKNDAAGFSGELTVLNNTSPLTAGLTSTTFFPPSATFSMNITDPDKMTVVVDEDNNDVVSYRYFGSGKAIFVGFDFYTSTPESQQIIANAIEWGGENALPQWIHLSRTNDTVSASVTSHVTVTFSATALPAGTYYANIGVSSNDLDEPIVIVPCTLTVSGDPILALSDTCLNIGSIIQHTTARDTLRIINNGCDTLVLNSVLSSSPDFVINSNVPYLLPGAYTDVVVTFQGNTVGVFNGSITILDNDIDTSVCLTARTTPAPVVNPSTSSITQPIRACSDTASTSFTISNSGVAGAGDLIFHLGNLPVWATASLTGDTLPVGTSVTITLHFNSGTLTGGTQLLNLQIISNDPLSPNKIIAVSLNVDNNPCISYTFQSATCTGVSDFVSSSINVPTSYLWDFGDGTTSADPNPSHGFPANGTYFVKLIACNSAGCDTTIDTIQAIITGPRAISCRPATTNYCPSCGIGITNFHLDSPNGTAFNNTTNDAIDGFKDYTCTDTATLLTRYPYNLSVTTGFTYEERLKMWIDLNNDGVLDSVTELLFDDVALISHTGTVFIPDYPSNVYGQPLRLRLSSDYTGNPVPEPCLDLQYGQVEDYSIFLNFFSKIDDVTSSTGFNVYPNPFSQSTSIDYNLKNSAEVSVEIFNIMGEKVSTFAANENQSSGKHSYQFNTDASGVYFVKLTVGQNSSIKKIIKM